MTQREIKFRAWNRKIKVFIYWTLDQMFKTKSVTDEEFGDNDWMQFTGLHDRNGKEIYEGDVVKGYIPNVTLEPSEVISSIYFEEGSFIFSKSNDEPITLREIIKISNKKECKFLGLEIIGNIHDNPELLDNK